MAVNWTTQDLQDRGKMSDQALANRMNVHPKVVRESRTADGIEPFIKHAQARLWTPSEVAMLGKLTDKKTARLLGRPVEHVKQARLSRGIPVRREKPGIVWLPEDLADIGILFDDVIAARKGCSVASVRLKRSELGKRPPPRDTLTTGEAALLGTMSDEAVAKTIGRSTRSVRASRTSRGIAMYDTSSNQPLVFKAEEIALLGTDPDQKIATKLGRSTKAVKGARIRRGIAPHAHPTKGRYAVPANSGLKLSWTELQDIDQHTFFRTLADAYREKVGRTLTYRVLARMSLWSTEQLARWFTPQAVETSLPLTARHHLWVSVALAV